MSIEGRARGLRRSLRLFKAFRLEQSRPEDFYSLLATDTLDELERRRLRLAGALLLDVGGASGYLAEQARARGCSAFTFEPSALEARLHGRRLLQGVRADGTALPVRDGAADLVCCSNVLEHCQEPEALLAEMVRVTRPGGLLYVSFTTWYGPWGGHETSPWHYLGGETAARLYEKLHGRPPKNRFGQSLYPLTVAKALQIFRETDGATLLDAWPRYYPPWAGWIVAVPGLREVATWNLAALLRREPSRAVK